MAGLVDGPVFVGDTALNAEFAEHSAEDAGVGFWPHTRA